MPLVAAAVVGCAAEPVSERLSFTQPTIERPSPDIPRAVEALQSYGLQIIARINTLPDADVRQAPVLTKQYPPFMGHAIRYTNPATSTPMELFYATDTNSTGGESIPDCDEWRKRSRDTSYPYMMIRTSEPDGSLQTKITFTCGSDGDREVTASSFKTGMDQWYTSRYASTEKNVAAVTAIAQQMGQLASELPR